MVRFRLRMRLTMSALRIPALMTATPIMAALTMAALLLVAAEARAQGAAPKASDVAPFLGTWVFAMSNPQGSEQTVRIADRNGSVAATLQIDKFPPSAITAIMKDGDMLVLTTTLRENGAPIWAVIALTRDGETMSMAQMLQQSQTIKRGTARRQAD